VPSLSLSLKGSHSARFCYRPVLTAFSVMAVTCEESRVTPDWWENRIKPIQTPINAEDGTNLVMALRTKVVGLSDGAREEKKEGRRSAAVCTYATPSKDDAPPLMRSMQTLVPRPECLRALRTEP
jgi:hypothetical protein